MTRRTVAFALAAAVLAVTAAGGCGLPDDRDPRVISTADAPLDLSEVPGADNPATPEGDDEVELYFVRDGGLLDTVMRPAENDDLTTTIQQLLVGPAEDEPLLSTSIPPETVLNSATVDGTTAVLDFGCVAEAPPDQCGLLGVGGQGQLTLFAQLVCTANDVRGVEAVRFLHAGEPQDAPTDGGTIQSPTPVTCNDYRSLQS